MFFPLLSRFNSIQTDKRDRDFVRSRSVAQGGSESLGSLKLAQLNFMHLFHLPQLWREGIGSKNAEIMPAKEHVYKL